MHISSFNMECTKVMVKAGELLSQRQFDSLTSVQRLALGTDHGWQSERAFYMLARFSNLRSLSITGVDGGTLPRTVALPTSLRVLSLSGWNVKFMPPDVGRLLQGLGQLETLELRHFHHSHDSQATSEPAARDRHWRLTDHDELFLKTDAAGGGAADRGRTSAACEAGLRVHSGFRGGPWQAGGGICGDQVNP